MHVEALETLNAMVIELYPDLVDAAADSFEADERFELQPEMTVATLRELLRAEYDWALAPEYREDPPSYFWYRSTEGPARCAAGLSWPGRRIRSRDAIGHGATDAASVVLLEEAEATTPIADIVRARPDLRHVVARVQSLAGLDSRNCAAELGVEHLLARLPRSVSAVVLRPGKIRGGAAEIGAWHVHAGRADRRGRGARHRRRLAVPLCHWCGRAREVNVRPTLTPYTMDGESTPRRTTRRPSHRAARAGAHGADRAPGTRRCAGVAEAAASLVIFAQACGRPAVAELLRHCSDGLVDARAPTHLAHRRETHAMLDARGGSALIAAPGGARPRFVAAHRRHGIGTTLVVNARRCARCWANWHCVAQSAALSAC